MGEGGLVRLQLRVAEVRLLTTVGLVMMSGSAEIKAKVTQLYFPPAFIISWLYNGKEIQETQVFIVDYPLKWVHQPLDSLWYCKKIKFLDMTEQIGTLLTRCSPQCAPKGTLRTTKGEVKVHFSRELGKHWAVCKQKQMGRGNKIIPTSKWFGEHELMKSCWGKALGGQCSVLKCFNTTKRIKSDI